MLAAQWHDVLEVVEERNFVHVDVGHDLCNRHCGILRVVVGTQQALFFPGDGNKKQRPSRRGMQLGKRPRHFDQRRRTRSIVRRPVVNAVSLDRIANAQVIQMGGECDIFILKLGIRAG